MPKIDKKTLDFLEKIWDKVQEEQDPEGIHVQFQMLDALNPRVEVMEQVNEQLNDPERRSALVEAFIRGGHIKDESEFDELHRSKCIEARKQLEFFRRARDHVESGRWKPRRR